FDFETMQEKKIEDNLFMHKVNLCVSQQVCCDCFKVSDINRNCERCGERQRVFKNYDIVGEFLEYVANMSKMFKVTCIVHNLRSFDGCLILKKMMMQAGRWQPSVIRTGCKLMTITCGNSIRFIDSLN